MARSLLIIVALLSAVACTRSDPPSPDIVCQPEAPPGLAPVLLPPLQIEPRPDVALPVAASAEAPARPVTEASAFKSIDVAEGWHARYLAGHCAACPQCCALDGDDTTWPAGPGAEASDEASDEDENWPPPPEALHDPGTVASVRRGGPALALVARAASAQDLDRAPTRASPGSASDYPRRLE